MARRNDEDLVVAQTHAAMIRFHNRVVAGLGPATPPGERFEKARPKVVLHGRLTCVGARLVVETFLRTMEGSHSIVRSTGFTPDLSPDRRTVPDGRPAAVRVQRPGGSARPLGD